MVTPIEIFKYTGGDIETVELREIEVERAPTESSREQDRRESAQAVEALSNFGRRGPNLPPILASLPRPGRVSGLDCILAWR